MFYKLNEINSLFFSVYYSWETVVLKNKNFSKNIIQINKSFYVIKICKFCGYLLVVLWNVEEIQLVLEFTYSHPRLIKPFCSVKILCPVSSIDLYVILPKTFMKVILYGFLYIASVFLSVALLLHRYRDCYALIYHLTLPIYCKCNLCLTVVHTAN